MHRVWQRFATIVLAASALGVFYSLDVAAQQADSRIAESKALVDFWAGDIQKLGSARELLQDVLKDQPDSIEARIQLARCELRFGYISGDQYEAKAVARARKWLHEAQQVDPTNGNIYLELANLDLIQRHFDGAADNLKKADELGASKVGSMLMWGNLYRKTDRYDDAIAKFQDAVAVAGDDRFVAIAAYEGLADCKVEKKDFYGAQAAHVRLIQLAPTSAWAYGNYSMFLRVYLNDFDGAEANARRALQIKNYGLARQGLARTLYMKWGKALIVDKDQAKAKKLFDEAYAIDPDPAGVLRDAPFWPTIQPVVPALKQLGVSIDYGGDQPDGEPLIMGAIVRDNLAYAKQLLNLGANVDARAFRNTTSLMIAALRGNSRAASLLLEHGADPTLVDVEGRDAANYARRAHFEDLASVLKNARESYASTHPQNLENARKSDNSKHTQVGEAQVAEPRDPVMPFRLGWIYRVRRSIPGGAPYGHEFAEGSEVIFVGIATYADKQLNGFLFRDPKGGRPIDWAVVKTEVDTWSQYFDEIGPANR